MAFRLLPLPAKLSAGATAFAELFNNFTDQRVRVEQEDGKLLWHIERCPLCWERNLQTRSVTWLWACCRKRCTG
jgi:hypothetical protein